MIPQRILVANRGEIAVRIISAIKALGLTSIALYSEDDESSLHRQKADASIRLEGTGAAAYLNIDGVLKAARTAECDAIHPGYGFLSENVSFAQECANNRIIFIGPSPDQLELFGDKVSAKAFAGQCGIPLISGTTKEASLEQAQDFLDSLGAGKAMMIKAIAGGGGRGMRVVSEPEELRKAYDRCRSEAQMAFGYDGVYLEQLIPRARHIEIQILGDGTGKVSHLWERECSVQRQHQKVVEIAPCPNLSNPTRQALINAALKMAEKASYLSLGTFEFLIDADDESKYYFIEANPRLQVEHTVTEAITGVDLVQTQIKIASGDTLSSLGLAKTNVPQPAGYAIQARINMETLSAKGRFKPTGGTLSAFEPPTGTGIRVDTFGYAGYKTSTRFDSLLAKVIIHSPSADYKDAVLKIQRSLSEFRIEGFETNIPFLQALLCQQDFLENRLHTYYVDENLDTLAGVIQLEV